MACGLLFVFALCDYILTTMQQGLGVKCVHNRWAYATYTMHEIGQNQRKKGGWAYITSWAYITYSTVPGESDQKGNMCKLRLSRKLGYYDEEIGLLHA